MLMLNGQFTVNGETYWCIDDTDRMDREMKAGTYNPIKFLQSFDVAIRVSETNAAMTQLMVDAMNEVRKKITHSLPAAASD